jgi:hypothetical protein
MNINEFVQHLASLDQITSDQFWLLKKTMNRYRPRKCVSQKKVSTIFIVLNCKKK